MKHYEIYKSNLKKFGYNDKENISDFWFNNKDRIGGKLFFDNGEIAIFSLHVRWESEIGKVFIEEIKKYIEQKQKDRRDKISSDLKKGLYNFHFAIIDFSDFKFEYNNVVYNIVTFVKLFPTSQITGLTDLRGINLDTIRLDSCIIRNCFFAEASFKNSSFQQLEFKNANFVNANFENSRFVAIRFDNKSTFNGANFKNAFINAIDLNDQNLGDRPLELTKVSYFKLLEWSVINLFRPIKNLENRNQTIFLANTTNGITKPDLIEFKKYVNWFQLLIPALFLE